MSKILVAYKKSRLQNFQDDDDSQVQRLLDEGNAAVAKLNASHERHQRSLESVCDTIEELGVEYACLHRAEVESVEGYDLVVAVGGDGTVLDLSHRIESTPLLAINSDPERSYGYFCAGSSNEFAALLEMAFGDEPDITKLMRFYIALNGERFGYPILNDVLVCHENPAAVTSVIMQVGDAAPEHQKSSGIWISTPAGSTAAIRSAGGYVMGLDSTDFQYLVREPCPPTLGTYRLLKGIHHTKETFNIMSKMSNGRVYLDGPHVSVDFKIGDVFSIDANAPSLNLLGLASKVRS